METRTDNEIIAEFMGETEEVIGPGGPYEYHIWWDRLMPVVEKIEKLYHDDFPKDFIQKILAKEPTIVDCYMDVIALPVATPISEVYEAVVSFIKWYSNQPQKAS